MDTQLWVRSLLLLLIMSVTTESGNPFTNFFDRIYEYISAGEDCVYQCADGGNAMTNASYISTSNGCGPSGFALDTSRYPIVTECCDVHDNCYGTCESGRDKCDEAFSDCLTEACAKLKRDGMIEADLEKVYGEVFMGFDFRGKHALVTGAGKGIGRTIAKHLLAAGAITYALSRTQADLDSLKLECPGMRTVCVDLSDWNATRAAIEALGDIELLVNNAARIVGCGLLDATEEIFDQVMSVNVKAVINVTQVIARKVITRQVAGAVVNISGLASRFYFPNRAILAASKSALDQLTRCMAVELGPHDIRVNSVQPTVVMTPMGRERVMNDPDRASSSLKRTPLGRFPELDEIAKPVLFLLSEKAAMINGTLLEIDAGYHCT